MDIIGQALLERSVYCGCRNAQSDLLKTIFLYIPMELLPGSPRLKLILLTLLINLVTFFLLVTLLKKILHEFKVDNSRVAVAVLWLSMIAGSAFWISFANSRNLEVAGGVYLLYNVLVIHRFNRKRQYVYLALFSGLLFFADTLQIYMTALPLRCVIKI